MNIVQRIRELAVQSSTGTYSTDDREKMQLELSNLLTELDQIAAETQFNGINILNGDVLRDIDKIYVEDALNGMVLPESLTNFFTESKFDDYQKPTGAVVNLDFSSYDIVDKIKGLVGTGFTLPNGKVYTFTDGQLNVDRGTAINITGISSAKDLTNKIKQILGSSNYDYIYSSSTEIKIVYHKSGSKGNDKNISKVTDIKAPPINEFNKIFTGGKNEKKAQISMDFETYFLSKLDLTKDIPSQLDGKGFRIDCSTCENEWINIQFVTDDKDVHPDNMGVNVKGIKTAEDLVKAIIKQTEGAGKLNHYTHFDIDKDDPSKLIVYDNRADRGNNGRLHDGIKIKKVEKEVE